MNLEKILPFFVLFLILISAIYFIFLLPKNSESSNTIPTKNITKECANGEEKSCINEKGCEGKQFCTNEEWGNCVILKICEPDSKEKCFIGCSTGYKECNTCGTNYSECIIPPASNCT